MRQSPDWTGSLCIFLVLTGHLAASSTSNQLPTNPSVLSRHEVRATFPIQDPLQTYTHEPRTTVDQKGMTRAQHERTKVLEAALKEKVQQIEECRRELRQKDRENASLQQNVDKMLKKLPEQDKGEFKHINQGNIILRLRDHEKLPWKLVESRFATETGLHRAWMSLAHEYYSIRNQSQHASMPEDAQVCLSQHNCCTTQAR